MSTIRRRWQAVAGRRRHGFGTYTMTAAGVWTYTLDNSNATVQALNVGEHADRHLHGDDGRRHGAGGDGHDQRRQRRGGDRGTSTGAVVEAGGVANAHAGHADGDGHDLDATDVDNPADSCQAVAAGEPPAGSAPTR